MEHKLNILILHNRYNLVGEDSKIDYSVRHNACPRENHIVLGFNYYNNQFKLIDKVWKYIIDLSVVLACLFLSF